MKKIFIDKTDSTNKYLLENAGELGNFTMVVAGIQTEGRGQRGNRWESEPGKNLTFSVWHTPVNILAKEQFVISEAVALAVVDLLATYGISATVKWPNDVYVGDSKICGILIEHSLQGSRICNSRIGVGINVNQTVFTSDAPNPMSMKMLTGSDYDLHRLAEEAGCTIQKHLELCGSPEGRTILHEKFTRNLWRGNGMAFPFRRRSEESVFPGVIVGVAHDGAISILDTATGVMSKYLFKEVEFIL
ncbi:MAG: biotin--[acetyl-CoA-carboxylase] ligase [Candidatus Amulumruptor caecigallinarius]|nr:biotin--[acetyl-CoA-carboxylase] ligase [Candidatus Amulumruptor caecigallinarius]